MGRQWLPAELADLPPGPELAAGLAQVDPARLNGHAPLSMLIGLSQAPALVGGYGPGSPTWCGRSSRGTRACGGGTSIYDDLDGDGQLAYHGAVTARPTRTGFSAADAAFLRARDRTCRGPQGCAVPASACDLDHTKAKVDGSGHERGNGGPLCRRDHVFRHQSGARLQQPKPGVFRWITPLGHRYTVKPEPYDESTGPPDEPQ